MDAIRLDNLSKSYRTGFWLRRFEAVRDISIRVPRGEAFGFVGPNGAGKTSTIKILAGLQNATSGEAFINGIPCSNPESRRHLGFLPERPYFYTHLTANEVLRFYGSLFGLSGRLLKDRIRTLLTRVEMTRFADVPLGKYSKGMLQRVGLCQTLLHDPEVILLDEPMSGLDPVGRALVRDIILEERTAGRTVFFCSHVLSDVESICQRVAILIRGEIRMQGRIQELISDSSEKILCAFKPNEETVIDELQTKKLVVTCRSDGLWEIELSDLEWKQFVEQYSTRVSIVVVQPLRKTLEEILVDEVQKESVSTNQLGVLA